MAVVIVSHDLETIAPLVDRLVILDAGAVAADAPVAAIFAQPSVLSVHGIAVPQVVAINAALRSRIPDWPIDAPLEAIADHLRFGVTQGSVSAAAEHHAEAAIELSGVWFRYPGAARVAIQDVSLSVATGEILAIVGNNGSGKTTLSKIMLGLLQPSGGSLRILGEKVQRIRPDLVGYIYQNPDAMLSQMSVAEEVAFTPRLLGRDDWSEQSRLMLDRFGLTELESRYPLALSTSQRQASISPAAIRSWNTWMPCAARGTRSCSSPMTWCSRRAGRIASSSCTMVTWRTSVRPLRWPAWGQIGWRRITCACRR